VTGIEHINPARVGPQWGRAVPADDDCDGVGEVHWDDGQLRTVYLYLPRT